VGDFIVPLLLKGYIKKVIYVDKDDKRSVKATAGSLHGEGKILRTNIARENLCFFPDHKVWYYKKTSDINALDTYTIGYDSVLDIDCDYFALNRIPKPNPPFKYSAAQMRRLESHTISDDKYKIRLRVLPDQLTRMKSMTFNDSRVWIELFIDYFTYYLSLDPKLTIIARSVKSGFTPAKYAKLIEDRLIERLEDPPSTLEIPYNERLEFTEFVARKAGHWYSTYTNQSLDFGPLENLIINAIEDGERLGVLRQRLLKACDNDELVTDYVLLRFVFNLKKLFVLR
jgi:hypothetical protein